MSVLPRPETGRDWRQTERPGTRTPPSPSVNAFGGFDCLIVAAGIGQSHCAALTEAKGQCDHLTALNPEPSRQSPMPNPIQIGTTSLDLQRRIVLRGGAPVAMQPKPFELFVVLAQRQGAIISKQELLETIWPGVFVTEDSLTQAVSHLRRALGPDGDLLRTVSKRGYMLVQGETDAVNARPHGVLHPRIAVLPLTRSPESAQMTLSGVGLADQLAALLARFCQLSVVNPGTVSSALDTTGNVAAAARLVNAVYVIDGSVKHTELGLSLAVRLSQVDPDRHIWGENYILTQQNSGDCLARIAMSVVGRLTLILERDAESGTFQALPLPMADILVTRGMVELRGYSVGCNEAASALFEEALEHEPDHAMAHAFLAMARLARQNFRVPDRDALNHARKAVRRAPEDSRCFRALGLAEACLGQVASGEASLRHALDLNPSDADTMSLLGFVMTCRGRAAEALAWFDRAFFLNPVPPDWYRQDQAIALLALDRYDDVLGLLRLHPRLKEFGEMRLAACFAVLGDAAEACHHLVLAREKAGTADLLGVIDGLSYYDDPATKQHFREQVALALAMEASFLGVAGKDSLAAK